MFQFQKLMFDYKKDYIYGCEQIKEERARFYNELIKIEGLNVYPSEANYFMMQLNNGSANELAEQLLEKDKILIKVLNGKNGFDDKEYVRIAIKSREENDYLLESIKRKVLKK